VLWERSALQRIISNYFTSDFEMQHYAFDKERHVFFG